MSGCGGMLLAECLLCCWCCGMFVAVGAASVGVESAVGWVLMLLMLFWRRSTT